MKEFLGNYIVYLQAKGYSQITIADKARVLDYFLNFLKSLGVFELCLIDVAIMELFYNSVLALKQKDGRFYSADRRRRYLVYVRDFFYWAIDKNLMLSNPALKIELPKIRPALPANVLSISQIDLAINLISLKTPVGVRNRSVVELLMASGLRTSELCNLTLKDVDLNCRRLSIRKSKGLKDRVLPISRRASFWLGYYLAHERKKFLKRSNPPFVYLSLYCKKMSNEQTLNMVKEVFSKAGLKASLRLLRHSYATHLLEQGMDIRYIQELLGHKKLETTQIYTRVSIGKLKSVHQSTHPLERR